MDDLAVEVTQREREYVLNEDHGDYAIVVLNRPEKRNAMNLAAQSRLREVLRETRDKKVVVLTGAGAAFCAGVDLVEAKSGAEPEIPRNSQELRSWSQCQEDIRRHPAVFIAAVNGFALGGGSTLINNCELAVAARSATIGTPEISFGEWPEQAGPAMIKRLLPKHAAELIFIAERVDAETAFRMGLVNEVVHDDQLMERAIEIATRVSGFDKTLLDWGKKAFHQLQRLDWNDAQDYSNYTNRTIRYARGLYGNTD